MSRALTPSASSRVRTDRILSIFSRLPIRSRRVALKQATSALVFAYSKRTDLPQILGDRGRLVQSFVNLEQ